MCVSGPIAAGKNRGRDFWEPGRLNGSGNASVRARRARQLAEDDTLRFLVRKYRRRVDVNSLATRNHPVCLCRKEKMLPSFFQNEFLAQYGCLRLNSLLVRKGFRLMLLLSRGSKSLLVGTTHRRGT